MWAHTYVNVHTHERKEKNKCNPCARDVALFVGMLT